MKRIKSILLIWALSLFAVVGALAANTITTVNQVNGSVDITEDVDYIITNAQPFTTAGSVNIVNTEHAVVIIQKIKPSVVISTWLAGNVFINGEQAKDGVNCQVKMYASGTIIMPYSKDIKPLTVYSEQDFKGTSVNDFGLENTGGYMNTLTDAKLNNKIRSFKLKRGYMVTFSTRKEGRGYSRCFIADKEDLEFASLPAILDCHISSYRVFLWLDAQRKGVHDTSKEANAALGTTWAFDWGEGNRALLPDVDWTSHHIYEDWPSAAACGGVTQTCHMQTNNEPGNSADDHPQDVATVLANWQNLMRTGMRLCSESSHDGSMGHLKAFMDSIDARGWRCDILDLHCYWDSGTFNNLTWYSDYYGNGRPIWISEWVWGASWNHNGAFADGRRNDEATYNGTVPILNILNSHSRVERYAYWNSEADFTKIWRGGKLTKLGEYYSKMETGLAYNKKNEFIPKNPKQVAASGLKVEFDPEKNEAVVRWRDSNGEYNQSMELQHKPAGTSTWKSIPIEQLEDAATYTYTLASHNGDKVRIRIVDLDGKEKLSNEITIVDLSLSVGSEMDVNGKTKYIGGNMMPNGDFELGLLGWTNGAGGALSAPNFQAVKVGGIDGGAYLQFFGNSAVHNAQTFLYSLPIEPETTYYISLACRNTGGSNQKVSASTSKSVEIPSIITLGNATEWTRQALTYTTTSTDKYINIGVRNPGSKVMLDEINISKLFDTKEEALADAMKCALARFDMFKTYTSNQMLIQDIQSVIDNDGTYEEISQALDNAIEALKAIEDIENMKNKSDAALFYNMTASKELAEGLSQYKEAVKSAEIIEAKSKIESSLNSCYKYTELTSPIKSPSFVSGTTGTSTGWTTKCGTYTGGDQRTNTFAGKPCWNAWWSTAASGGAGTTMEIKQEITIPETGLYALECLATTQHLCITDQHAYIKTSKTTLNSDTLSLDLGDIPTVKDADKWQQLVTPYIFLEKDEKVTIGFKSSKQGAVDGSWRPYDNPSSTGDNRNGWWCATDFKLRQIPILKRSKGENKWGTICSPNVISVADGVKLYKVVGITADQTRICLEEATSTVSGTPYVYYSDNDIDYFIGTGTPTTSAKNYKGFIGLLKNAIVKVTLESFFLENDRWQHYQAGGPKPLANDAYIQVKTLPTNITNDWYGKVIYTKDLVSEEKIQEVINGVVEEKIAERTPKYPNAIFNIAGQRLLPENADAYKGILIQNGKKRAVK